MQVKSYKKHPNLLYYEDSTPHFGCRLQGNDRHLVPLQDAIQPIWAIGHLIQTLCSAGKASKMPLMM
jgi:hypothetical protein